MFCVTKTYKKKLNIFSKSQALVASKRRYFYEIDISNGNYLVKHLSLFNYIYPSISNYLYLTIFINL